MNDRKEHTSDTSLIRMIGVVVLAMYTLALVWPEHTWGFHAFLFLSPVVKFGLPALALGLILFGNRIPALLSKLKKVPYWWVCIPVVVLLTYAFHSFPIESDFYGDAPRHMELFGEYVDTLDTKRTQNVFSLDVFNPKIGEITVLNGVERVAYATGRPTANVFHLMDVFSGLAFLLVWCLFVFRYTDVAMTRFVLVLLGVTAPFLQVFFGHIEIYAPYFVAVTAYLGLLFMYFKDPKQRTVWGLAALLLLCMKLHFVSVLLLPSFILAVAHVRDPAKWATQLTWKNAFRYVLTPVVIGGILAYVFVFKDYNDPRVLDGSIDTSERLFLPVISPEAPLDRYNLFSVAHFLDFFNVLFLWSGAAWLVVIFFVIRRKMEVWNKPEVLVTGMSLLFFCGLYFMINPLLSMPIDWDLFVLPAPLLLFLVAGLLRHGELNAHVFIAPVLAISMFAIPFFAVNADGKASSQRLQTVGEYCFKTYWIRSAGTITHALEMDSVNMEARLKGIIRDLEPWAHKGDDKEYAHLLWYLAKYYYRQKQDDKAIEWHERAAPYAVNYPVNTLSLVSAYYRAGDFRNAYLQSIQLVEKQYPSRLRALKIAIDCAMQAGHNDHALQLSEEVLQLYPEDTEAGELMDEVLDSGVSKQRHGEILLGQITRAFERQEYDQAFLYSERLVELQFPDPHKALRISIHCAIQADKREEAVSLCKVVVKDFPEDTFIAGILEKLNSGTPLSIIAQSFKSQ